MKQNKKKAIALITVICMILTMFPMAVYADGNAFTVSKTIAKANDQVEVTFTQPAEVLMSGMTLKVSFDNSKFEATEVSATNYPNADNVMVPTATEATTAGYVELAYMSATAEANVTVPTDSKIMTLKLKVKEGALSGNTQINVETYSVAGARDAGSYSFEDITPNDAVVGEKTRTVEIVSELTGDQTITMGTKPASGEETSTVTASGTNFTVGFDNWKEQGGGSVITTFAAGKTYTADCTLTAKTGYVFAAEAAATIAGPGNGSAEASTVSDGGKTLKFTYTFGTPALPSQDVTFATPTAMTKTYGEAKFTNAATNNTTGGPAPTYASDNSGVATVNSTSGEVTIVGQGEANITATAAAGTYGGTEYEETKVSYKLTVEPKELTNLGFSGVTVTKVYDGTTDAGAVSGTINFEGKVDTDDVSINAVAGNYADKNAGNGKTVTLALSLEGAKKENYKLSSYTHSFDSAAITAATQTITAATPRTIVKNGVGIDISSWASSDAPGATLEYSLDGTHSGISLTGTTLTAAADTTTATFNVRVNSDAVNVDGTVDNEYSAALEKTIVVNVTTKEDAGVTISGTVPTGKTYGDANFTLRATKTCLDGTNGQWQWTSSDNSILEIVSGANTAVATIKVKKADITGAAISVTYTSDSHYGIKTTASIPVAKKAVTVAPKNFTITKGSAIPAFELAYTGLVNGDALAPSPDPTFTCYEADGTTSVSTTTAAGTYTITWTNKSETTFASDDNYVVNKTATGTLTIKNPSSGGGGYLPPAQKPTITSGEGVKVTLSSDGTVAAIKVDAGYELVDVVLNGTSKGKVTEVKGLKTGDKLVVTAAKKAPEPAEPTAEEIIATLADHKLAARSKVVTMKNGKKAVRITWYNANGEMMEFDGVEIFRSTKKNSGYGNKPFYATKESKSKGYYINTKDVKVGTTYYYKLRGYVVIDGQKYYTDYSLKAIRTVK